MKKIYIIEFHRAVWRGEKVPVKENGMKFEEKKDACAFLSRSFHALRDMYMSEEYPSRYYETSRQDNDGMLSFDAWDCTDENSSRFTASVVEYDLFPKGWSERKYHVSTDIYMGCTFIPGKDYEFTDLLKAMQKFEELKGKTISENDNVFKVVKSDPYKFKNGWGNLVECEREENVLFTNGKRISIQIMLR